MFRQRINELFGERNCSVVAFADEIGITRQSLTFYLNGDRFPDFPTLRKICQSLDVSADWLLGLSDIRFRDPDYEKMLVDASRLLDGMKKQSVQYLLYMTETISKLDAIGEPVLHDA